MYLILAQILKDRQILETILLCVLDLCLSEKMLTELFFLPNFLAKLNVS